MWCIPQSLLPVLPPDLAGVAAVEFGCGSAYVSAWLARRGARPVGVDVSAAQLAVAHRLQGEFGLRFPLVQADAERVPLGAGCAGLVISEYGASVWCDPYRWIPEAARLLRPGGRLVFMAQSTLARLCMPEDGRPQIGWCVTCSGCTAWCGGARQAASTSYSRCRTANGSGSWGRCGLVVQDMIEVQVPPGAANHDFPELPDQWARRWPAEEVWFARRQSAAWASGTSRTGQGSDQRQMRKFTPSAGDA